VVARARRRPRAARRRRSAATASIAAPEPLKSFPCVLLSPRPDLVIRRPRNRFIAWRRRALHRARSPAAAGAAGVLSAVLTRAARFQTDGSD
jgi:hypothetical protein